MMSTEEQPGAQRPRRLQPFASFRYRNYRWLWAANVTHGAVQGALSFSFVWLTIEMLDGSGFDLSLVDAALGFPIVLLALLAGRFADRRDRRLLLMTSHVAVALFLSLAAVLVAADVISLGLLVVLALLAAAGLALGEPVRIALIPALVPKERLLNANALDSLGLLLGGVAGAALQGVILGFWVIEAAFVLQAVMVGAGALFLLPLRIPPREPAPENGAAPKPEKPATVSSDIAEGFRFLWNSLELRMLFVLLLAATLIGPWVAVELAGDRFDLSPLGRGVVSLFLGVGPFVTAVVLTMAPRVRNAGLLYGLAITAAALLLIFVWLSPFYVLTALLVGLIGLTLGFRWLVFQTMVQSHTPITVMGRVAGIYLMLTAAAGLLSPQIARGGQALLEDEGWIVCSAIVLVGVVAMILWRNPGLRRMPSHPEAAKPVDEEVTVAPGTG